VRTPLKRILLPVIEGSFAEQIKTVEQIILAEVNVKGIEYMENTGGIVVKKVKPNFPKLGKQYGAKMKEVAAIINSFTKDDIAHIEKNGRLTKNGIEFTVEDVLIHSEDIPGWSVATDGPLTVALDVNVTEDLKREGIARDFVNRVQNLRKDLGLEVLDKISIEVERDGGMLNLALTSFEEYISTETQALSLEFKDKVTDAAEVDMDDFMLRIKISVKK
jgi:isoleucyl-tRNA synthetase